MKQIDENFFKQELKTKTIEDTLQSNEKILWKGCPKKSSYAINNSLKMMPIAIFWGLIDFGIIFGVIIPQGIMSQIGFFIIPFFALHLTPVWIWLGQLIKAAKILRGTKYIITNKRILEFKSDYGYIKTTINLDKITNISIKRSSIDKLLLVGDIYISSNTGSLVLFDIPKSEYIYGKLREICDAKSKAKETYEFYPKHNECEHCGSFFDTIESKCPNCGAPIKKDKRNI